MQMTSTFIAKTAKTAKNEKNLYFGIGTSVEIDLTSRFKQNWLLSIVCSNAPKFNFHCKKQPFLARSG